MRKLIFAVIGFLWSALGAGIVIFVIYAQCRGGVPILGCAINSVIALAIVGIIWSVLSLVALGLASMVLPKEP